MFRKGLKVASIAVTTMLLIALSGCTIMFTLEGKSNYLVMPNGSVLDDSHEECEMEMYASAKGSMLKPPVSMDIELEGLLMGNNDVSDIANYIKDTLGFDSVSYDEGEGTFLIIGEYGIDEFWTGMGVTSAQIAAGTYEVPLADVIGDMEYAALVQCIVDVEGDYMGEATSIELEMSGILKEDGGSAVGTFILWMDALKPIQ